MQSKETLPGKVRCCHTEIFCIVMTTEANGIDQAGVGDCYAASRVAPTTIDIKPTFLNPTVLRLPLSPQHHPASSPRYYVMSSVPLSLTSCLAAGRW